MSTGGAAGGQGAGRAYRLLREDATTRVFLLFLYTNAERALVHLVWGVGYAFHAKITYPGWQVLISMPAGEELETPYSLKAIEETPLDQELPVEGDIPEKVDCYQGVFYNYFSIGMDAQVAYGFHNLRNEKPYLAQGPISNKGVLYLILLKFYLRLGPLGTPTGLSYESKSLGTCHSSHSGIVNLFWIQLHARVVLHAVQQRSRSLRNILRIYFKKVNHSKWEQIPVPSSVRSIVALNLPSYGSGRNPWGNLKPDYLEKRGFVEAHADDGCVEVFGLKQGWHASMVMVELISAKHIAQASAIRFELRGGEWKEAYMQMDGEPWRQRMDKEYSTFVEIKRVPHHSIMVRAE
ncbi:Diacylglycerol kinase [Sesamum angolense]|uniref:Diacylglycerol kinase n=1 Tax=Sesamum angolense TaxID=2727404 RepID=A0AAE2C0H3_9LAMI|nr:Diacylglycerol kinase [Sesamum angolense]